MSDPKDYETYCALIHANQKITGFGIDTSMEMPCYFCAAPGFIKWRVLEMEQVASQDHKCKSCGRSAKMIFEHSPGGINFEVVQTGGPDQPDWLEPKMRRVS